MSVPRDPTVHPIGHPMFPLRGAVRAWSTQAAAVWGGDGKLLPGGVCNGKPNGKPCTGVRDHALLSTAVRPRGGLQLSGVSGITAPFPPSSRGCGAPRCHPPLPGVLCPPSVAHGGCGGGVFTPAVGKGSPYFCRAEATQTRCTLFWEWWGSPCPIGHHPPLPLPPGHSSPCSPHGCS